MRLRLLGYLIAIFCFLATSGTCSFAQEKTVPPTETTAGQTLIDDTKQDGDEKPDEADKSKDSKETEKTEDPIQDDTVVPKQDEEASKPEKKPTVATTSPLRSVDLLPPSTRAWISIPDLERLESQFDKTQLGQLAADPDVKPFFEAAKKQLQDFLDEKNLKVGLRFDDLVDVRSGELCIAGVLQDLEGGQPARGSHGLVLLVDVTGNEDRAHDLLTKVNAEMVKSSNGALEAVEISGVAVSKFSAQNPKRIRKSRTVYQSIHRGWMLVADNEEIFRDILRRLVAPEKVNKSATLSMQPTFLRVMAETELHGAVSELSWFVDPFGYLQLAQKLYDEEQEIREHHDDWPRTLRDVGFDAVKGVGGNFGVMLTVKDQELENFSRMFIYAPRENINEKHQRFFDMFDFNDRKPSATEPRPMISDNTGAYFAGSWQFTKLLGSVGYIYDSVTKEEDGFKRMLHDFKHEPEFQVDIPKLVGMLDDQLFVFSTTEEPISPTSERAAVGIPLKANADAKEIMSSLKRLAKGSVEINLGGKTVIEVDTTVEPTLDDMDLPPGFEEGFEDDLDDEEQKKEQRFSLFEKRYMVVHNGILIVANDKQYLRHLLSTAPGKKLADSEDYQSVKSALDKLTDPDKVAFRRFVRLDRIYEVNYSVLQKGEMTSSPTMMGRLLNRMHEKSGREPGVARTQKLDGTSLPEDYKNKIAPFLGPSGWVTEIEPDGWRISGCLIKKPPAAPPKN